jgi:N-acetylneuraminate synthase
MIFEPGMNTSRTYIIAEAGVNHNGSLDMAMRLVDVAADAGADAVKFQTFKTEKVVCRNAPKADYQNRTTGPSESQFDMIKKLELDEAAHEALLRHCREKKIQFLSTPFDLDSVSFLSQRLNLPSLKISSGDITNAPLLLKIANTGKVVLLSTGMSSLGEIELALGVLAFGFLSPVEKPSVAAFSEAYCSDDGQHALREKVVLLHCTTEYPAPIEDVNLLSMDTLRDAFGLRVGYSDHTQGIAVALAAAARGAAVVEKHFTLDQNLPGPDHRASLDPHELYAMVDGIRQIESALGRSAKFPAPSELKNRDIARKSLVTSRAIIRGEVFTAENLTTKRPGTGIKPILYWEWLGKKAPRSYQEDELV